MTPTPPHLGARSAAGTTAGGGAGLAAGAVLDEVRPLHGTMVRWRHHIHRHPELAFEEHRTAAFVGEQAATAGLEVTTGIGGTGVVATLRRGTSGRAIGLRAELDALPLTEVSDRPHRSLHEGRMHACGHDGHMAMLLGAAHHLAATGGFDGTVHFIFQPAEENEAGGRAMLDDGLLERFPMESVYALHTEPGLALATFALRSGPVMAALDLFEIVIEGEACHAARPHTGADAIVAAGALVSSLQSVVSRDLDPQVPAVVSVTGIDGGRGWNILPAEVELRGTVRAFDDAVRTRIERGLRRRVEAVSAAHGCRGHLDYRRHYPVTVNDAAPVAHATAAARAVVGEAGAVADHPPLMAAEDFGFLLEQRPGCYAFLGNGDSAPVHSPDYDFDDRALPYGAAYWVTLVRRLLGGEGQGSSGEPAP